MDFNSPLYDKVRLRPRAEGVSGEAEPRPAAARAGASRTKGAEAPRADAATCDHPGCARPGEFRAPKGRGREGQFHRFCLDHVREYNATYNYFAGLPDDAVAAYQKDAMTGHRPTWKMGVNPDAMASAAGRTEAGARRRNGTPKGDEAAADLGADVFGLFGFNASRFAQTRAKEPETPRFGPLVVRAFETLGLEPGSEPAAIKKQFKALVKRYHPDANGGDRAFEHRLQGVVQAYDQLRAAGHA